MQANKLEREREKLKKIIGFFPAPQRKAIEYFI